MCGIAGFHHGSLDNALAAARLDGMIRRLAHRGPDSSGYWFDSRGLAIAHARLAILDLSEAGHQPMLSVDGRWALVFNGEIYNHLELRRDLAGRTGARVYRGHSDTETLLALIEHDGVATVLPKLEGMFAFAVWDLREERLFLARDLAGEKPLLYRWRPPEANRPSTFEFASELKALVQPEDERPQLSLQAVDLFLQYNQVPAPLTILEGVWKLRPGHFLTWSARAPEREPEIKSFRLEAESARAGDEYWTAMRPEKEWIDETERRLRRAVGLQMLSDVPLGSFLSGGIDSSLVTALMQAESRTRVRSFTIGFREKGFDESAYAEEVARHLGCDHQTWILDGSDALAIVPRLARIYDEPFADSSQIPTCLLAAMTRKKVTVALSGDGGDELFGGYSRYLWVERLWEKFSALPLGARRALGESLLMIPHELLSVGLDALLKVRFAGVKIHKVARAIKAGSSAEFYEEFLRNGAPRVLKEPVPLSRAPSGLPGESLLGMMMREDFERYLPDDILVKVDRASMAVALESRAPFLMPEIVRWSRRMPADLKVRDGKGKWVLRQVLKRHVPEELFERPKAGFAAPVERWLRSDLRAWAEDLLSEERLEKQGLLDTARVRGLWDEHLSEKRDHSAALWAHLQLQSWIEQWMK